MTQAQRDAAFLLRLQEYTVANTVSKEAAEEALKREGFVLENGEPAPEFAPEEEDADA